MQRVSALSPETSPKQLHSADCLSGKDREASVSPDSSGGSASPFRSNNLGGNCQDYEFLQVPSPLGMDHPESFMDQDTDIIQSSPSDSEISDPSPAYAHEVIQKSQRRFFPEDISVYEASIHIPPHSKKTCPLHHLIQTLTTSSPPSFPHPQPTLSSH